MTPGPAADSGADVVAGPEVSEVIAADRQLPDELVEQRVIDLGADERTHVPRWRCARAPPIDRRRWHARPGGVQEGRAQQVHHPA